MTPPELALWMRLRRRAPGPPVFRRQHPFGPYVLDFYCAKAKLAVEADGQSHLMGDRPARDVRREAFLTQLELETPARPVRGQTARRPKKVSARIR